MTRKRCTENHPTVKKFRQLKAYAEQLGISLDFTGEICTLKDRDCPVGRVYQVVDIENAFDSLTGFPHGTETKLIFEE